MIDILVVKSDSIVYNSRVRKIIGSLAKKYSLSVIGWNREGLSLSSTDMKNINLLNIRAPYGKPSFLPYIPLFWVWVLFKLISLRPRVVHACDFDTILPCYMYKLFLRKKLVFEIIDRYAPSKVSPRISVLYRLVNFLEEQFSMNSDLLVVVTPKVLQTFRRRPKQYAIIMNCSEENGVIDTTKVKADGLLTLVYTGAIIKNRGLERITSAIEGLDGVELLIAGKVIDSELLAQLLQLPNVRYEGLLHPNDALALEARSDAIIILYDLRKPNNNFASPTKTFEAMRFGIPVITNVATELINELDCGIIVDYNNLGQIREAVISLRDNIQLRTRLGRNGHEGYLRKYNWKTMEKELHDAYPGLL